MYECTRSPPIVACRGRRGIGNGKSIGHLYMCVCVCLHACIYISKFVSISVYVFAFAPKDGARIVRREIRDVSAIKSEVEKEVVEIE